METKGKHMASDDIGLFITPEETDELGDTNDLSAAKDNMTNENEPAYPEIPKYIMPNKAYDILKWVGLVLCYALAIFTRKVGSTWDIDIAGKVADTIEAIGLLIGMCIGASQLSSKEK